MPTFDAAASGTTVNAASVTYSHTVGTANFICARPGWTPFADRNVSVTYAGDALTELASARATNTSPRCNSNIFYKHTPATGANNVVCTMASGYIAVDLNCGSDSWDGVDSTTPMSNGATATGTSTTPSVTGTSDAGDVIVGVVTVEEYSGVDSVSSGDTERWEKWGDPFNGTYTAGSSSTNTSETMNWTHSSSTVWAASCGTINAAAGGGAAFIKMVSNNFRLAGGGGLAS